MASTEGAGYIPPMPPQQAPDRPPRFGTVLIRVLAVQIVTLLLLWLLQSRYGR